MEQLNLPFRLEMDYEELEFDLEILPVRIQGYDSYIYLGEFNNFLDNTANRIELLFRMDVLAGIIITLPLKDSVDVITKLESLLGSPQIVIEHSYQLCRFNAYQKDLLLYISKRAICIVLCNTNISYSLYLSLLCCHIRF